MSAACSPALWMLAMALTAALQGTCIRALGDGLEWQTVLLVRTALGLAFAITIARSSRIPVPFPGPRSLWVRSISGSLALLCTFFASTQIPIANVTLLLHSAPIWLLLASWLILRQPTRWTSWLAVAIGLVGIALVVNPAASLGGGELLAAISGVLSAISIFAVTRMRHIHALAIVVHANAAALVVSLAVTLSTGGIDTQFVSSARALGLLVAVAALGIFVQFALIRAYTGGNTQRLAPLQYSTIIAAVLCDFAFFGHAPSLLTGIGMVCVVGPLFWIVTRPADPAVVRHGTIEALAPLQREDLVRLEDAIARGEELTSAEVRIHLEQTCADRVLRPRAVFDELAMSKTRLRNGVLLYMALETRVIAVVFDRGIADAAPRQALESELAHWLEQFRVQPVSSVLERGIVRLCTELGATFPPQPNDVNELTNSISVAAHGW